MGASHFGASPAATPGIINNEVARSSPTPSLQQTATRAGHDVATGARVETGEAIHTFLSHLIQCGAPVTQALGFLHIKAYGTVQLLHSLFTLPLGLYNDKPLIICALVGDFLDTGLPRMFILPKLAFAANASFLVGTADDFESHVTGLNSTDLGHLDTNAYQVEAEGDNGARTIESRGLTFLSGEAMNLVLDFGPAPSIASVTSTLVPLFLHSDLPYVELGMDWFQASFTARDDGKFVRGPIRTRQDINALTPRKGSFAHTVVTSHISHHFPSDPTLRIRGGSFVATPPSPTTLEVAGGAALLTAPIPTTPQGDPILTPPTPATPRGGTYGAGSIPTRPLVGGLDHPLEV